LEALVAKNANALRSNGRKYAPVTLAFAAPTEEGVYLEAMPWHTRQLAGIDLLNALLSSGASAASAFNLS
jgi:hypothetical protein